MPTQEQLENAVAAYIVYDRHLLLNIITPTLYQRNELLKTEDEAFHPEIYAQFETLIRREIAEEIAKAMNLDPEQVFIIVETMDVNAFVGGYIPMPPEEDEEIEEVEIDE